MTACSPGYPSPCKPDYERLSSGTRTPGRCSDGVRGDSKRGRRVPLPEPVVRPLCRSGRYPSLGPILEQQQLVASHAVITVEGGRYGVTSFGSRAVPDAVGRSWGVHSSLDTIAEELRFATPRLLAIASTESEVDHVVEDLQAAFSMARIICYQIGSLDHELDRLADQVVRDAATLAAEDVAHALGEFRAATAEGLAVEGPDVIEAIERGDVVAVLVHDDVDDDRSRDGDRLVDIALTKALAAGIQVTMIPGVDERRGPAGGLGGIVGGARVGATAAIDDEHLSIDMAAESGTGDLGGAERATGLEIA